MPVSGWLEEGNEILHTHEGLGEGEYYSAVKKNELMKNEINGNGDHYLKRGKPDLNKHPIF